MPASDSSEPPNTTGPTYDVIVVGLGVMGLATCWRLAQQGRSVLGLEQFDLHHDHGSSHGSTRVFRHAYYEHSDYAPLMRDALAGWRELEADSGKSIVHSCGVLSLGPAEGRLLRGVRETTARHGLNGERLSPAEVTARYGIDLPSDGSWEGHLEPEAGYLYAARAMETLAEEARGLGAELLDCQFVREWRETAHGVEVETEETTFRGRSLLITTGGWAREMLAPLGIDLEVVRKLIFWYLPAAPERTTAAHLPVFVAETSRGLFYGVPDNQDTAEDGVKIARHDESPEVHEAAVIDEMAELRIEHHVDEQEEMVRPMIEDFARVWLGQLLLQGEDRELVPSDFSVCLYTYSPDGHFILDRHPSYSRVSIAAGFSGHGFKFAPAIGSILASLADGGELPANARFLSLGRFAKR